LEIANRREKGSGRGVGRKPPSVLWVTDRVRKYTYVGKICTYTRIYTKKYLQKLAREFLLFIIPCIHKRGKLKVQNKAVIMYTGIFLV